MCDVCVRLFCVCAVLYLGRGLATGGSLVTPQEYGIRGMDKKKRIK
jgi:hypothetical protein